MIDIAPKRAIHQRTKQTVRYCPHCHTDPQYKLNMKVVDLTETEPVQFEKVDKRSARKRLSKKNGADLLPAKEERSAPSVEQHLRKSYADRPLPKDELWGVRRKSKRDALLYFEVDER